MERGEGFFGFGLSHTLTLSLFLSLCQLWFPFVDIDKFKIYISSKGSKDALRMMEYFVPAALHLDLLVCVAEIAIVGKECILLNLSCCASYVFI